MVLLGEFVPESLIAQWKEGLAQEVSGAELYVVQNTKDVSGLAEMSRLIDLYSEGRETLAARDSEIGQLRGELESLTSRLALMELPQSLGEEIQLQHPAVAGARMGLIQSTGSENVRPQVEVLWMERGDSVRWSVDDQERIASWLRVRLANDAAEVRHTIALASNKTGVPVTHQVAFSHVRFLIKKKARTRRAFLQQNCGDH